MLRNLNTDFPLNDCLFGSVKLTKNPDPDNTSKVATTGFDFLSELLFTDGSMGKNVIIFGANMSSSVHIDNKNKDIIMLGEGPTQGLDNTALTEEAILYIELILHSQMKNVY